MNFRQRLEKLEAAVFPQPAPAPHPLAGLEYESAFWADKWFDKFGDPPSWWQTRYTKYRFRDSTTHAPVPLWQVAKRLGVEHPVPPEVRWTDVEMVTGKNKDWPSVADLGFNHWADLWWMEEPHIHTFRLTAQYDYQPITYAQFREILGRGEKVATAPNATAADNPLYRVGDLVEVVEVPEGFSEWFSEGERFVAFSINERGSPGNRAGIRIPAKCVRLISRPS